jgi:integrase
MGRKLPPFCYREKSRHGRIAYYVRRERKGARIRLPDDLGSPSWWEAYYAALAGQKPAIAPRGGLARLIDEYQTSGEFLRLADQTREQRAGIFRRMIEANPDIDASDIQPEHIRAGMSRRTGNAANTFVKALRGLFQWAVATGRLDADPTSGIVKINVQSSGYHAVTADEVDRFRAHWGADSRQVLALDVAILTGARRGDLAILGPRHVIDGVIEFPASKTGQRCYVPVLGRMGEIIADAKAQGRATFIARMDGEPYGVESLGEQFRRWFADAGLPHCSVHGLRKHSATVLANMGVSGHSLMAIFGWKRLAMAETYTREFDRRRLAMDAGGLYAPRTLPKGKGQ